MPLSGCTNGLVVTAVVTLLLLPAQYYVPELYPGPKEPISEPRPFSPVPTTQNGTQTWYTLDFPPLDLFLTFSLISLAIFTYLCDWIQRKLLERRITKLNRYVCENLAQLRGWDARQEKLELTLRMVQNATSEYGLLLMLLLRRHPLQRPAAARPPACDKGLGDLGFVTNPAVYEAGAL